MGGVTLGRLQCYMQELFALRNIDVKKMFELIDKHEVTHFGGAPISIKHDCWMHQKENEKN